MHSPIIKYVASKKENVDRIQQKMLEYQKENVKEPWLRIRDSLRMLVVVEDPGMLDAIVNHLLRDYEGKILNI